MRKYLAVILSLVAVAGLFGAVSGSPAQAAPQPQEGQELELELMVLSWDDWSVHCGEALADELGQIGIKVDLNPLDDSVMYPRIDARNYSMFEMALGYDAVPTHMFYRFHSSQDFEGGSNYWSYRNPQYDQVIEQAMSAPSLDQAKQYMYQAQEILVDDLPYIPLFLTQDVHAFYKGWEGVHAMPGGPINSFNKLTIVDLHHPEKDTFVMAYPSFPRSLNPMPATDGRSLWYVLLVYDSLLAYDDNLNLIPWMADNWSVSDNGQTITFHLRDGLKWHDGQPVTAEDVAFTFEYAKQNEAYGSFYVDVTTYLDSVETPDNRTVVVHLTKPYVFAANAFGLVPIVPKHIWESVPSWDWPSSDALQYGIGSGPFKLVDFVEGDYIELEKFDDYWLEGAPKVDHVTIRVIDSSEARILAIKNGEADTHRYELEPAYIAQLENDPNIDLYRTSTIWDYVLGFNLNQWPMNDSRFREAIALAIDRDEIVQRAALGAGYATDSFVPSVNFGDWENPNAKLPSRDLDRARQLLAEMGFRDVDNDGILEYSPPAPTPPPSENVTPSPPPPPPPPQAGADMTWLIAGVVIVIIGVAAALILKRR